MCCTLCNLAAQWQFFCGQNTQCPDFPLHWFVECCRGDNRWWGPVFNPSAISRTYTAVAYILHAMIPARPKSCGHDRHPVSVHDACKRVLETIILNIYVLCDFSTKKNSNYVAVFRDGVQATLKSSRKTSCLNTTTKSRRSFQRENLSSSWRLWGSPCQPPSE